MKGTAERAPAAATEPARARRAAPASADRARARTGVGCTCGGGCPACARADAQRALSGASSSLPHHPRIAAAFGRHDVSALRARVGGGAADAARRLGAVAFTSGDRVAFRAAPDLRLAAHEAAHAVQQRTGLAVPGGIGRPGDRWERHADAVADAVVRGGSAEPLLDRLGPPRHAAATPVLQLQDDETDLERWWREANDTVDDGVDWARRQYRRARRVVREGVQTAERLAERGRGLAERGLDLAERAPELVEEGALDGARGTEEVREITFDGEHVELRGTSSFRARAVSGLLPNHPDAEGIDFTQPEYQDRRDIGPIPEGEYYVRPSDVESNPPHRFNVGAWGRYRTILHPTVGSLARTLSLGRRGGFYLHQDANHNGTAGCIGLVNAGDNAEIARRIAAATATIPVRVAYPAGGHRTEEQAAGCPACEPPGPTRDLVHPRASTATTYTEVEGAWEAALAARDPDGGEIRVVGEAIERIRANRGTRRAWTLLFRDVRSYRFDIPRGHRVATFTAPDPIAYGGDYFRPSDYFTTGTWLIGHCYPSAVYEVTWCRDESGAVRGLVRAIWAIHDNLDLQPGVGRGPVYNTGAHILTWAWHDNFGLDETLGIPGGRRNALLYAQWEDTMEFCLLPDGTLLRQAGR